MGSDGKSGPASESFAHPSKNLPKNPDARRAGPLTPLESGFLPAPEPRDGVDGVTELDGTATENRALHVTGGPYEGGI